MAGDLQAYVFDLVGGVWTETATLSGGTPVGDVDLSGDRVALGSDTSVSGAFVFEKTGPAWDAGTQLEVMPLPSAVFGSAVAIEDDRLAVMASALLCTFGGLYGYERLPGGWRQSTQSLGFNGVPAAALDQGRLAFAASGALQVVRTLPSGGWVAEELHSSGVPSSIWGDESVDLSGGFGVLGTPSDAAAGVASGAVRIWRLAPLAALPEAVSVLSGGTQELELRRSPFEAFSLYWIFGSATGTSPGLSVDGLPLPLNFDGYYLFLALNPNTVVVPTIGLLDEVGQSPSEVTLLPLDPTLVGATLHHAYLTIRLVGGPLVDFASNAVPLRLVTEADFVPEDFETGAPGWELGSGVFTPETWQIVEDGECGAVTRMVAYTSAAPSCGGALA